MVQLPAMMPVTVYRAVGPFVLVAASVAMPEHVSLSLNAPE